MSEERISRRRMLKRIGAGAAIAWTAPAITSINAPSAFAASPSCDCITNPCGIGNCGPPAQGCSCANTADSGCQCFIPACLGPCVHDADCGPGFACAQDCCGPPTCAQLCTGSTARYRGRAWSRA